MEMTEMSEAGINSKNEQVRTMGDGLDNSYFTITESNINKFLKASPRVLHTFKPVEPKSKVFNLVPKYVAKERKIAKCLVKKPKEPKFVPYEPYKASVIPIKSERSCSSIPVLARHVEKSNNNIEIHELVKQMSDMCKAELHKADIEMNDSEVIQKHVWEKEKKQHDIDMRNLMETNAHLENQLKFQAQVNSELKTLLVAAVGEDLESRVQHLTEDKLSLARALLNSANHLTSHQEKTEWLSGQCEVWRSKFLASSLMVEELARWKSALTNRTSELQEVIKQLLEQQSRIQKFNSQTYINLKHICNGIPNENVDELQKCNILELARVNLELSSKIKHSLNVTKTDADDYEVKKCITNMEEYTLVEKNAIKLLQHPVIITNKPDALFKAVVGAASSLVEERKQEAGFPGCCGHCRGEIQNL